MNDMRNNDSGGNEGHSGKKSAALNSGAVQMQNAGGQGSTNGAINHKGKKQEVEKTSYEKFEDSVRETIFNVLYVLLKNEEHSKFDTTIEVVADMIQIYSFTFSQAAAFPWRQEDVMFYFEWFFNIFQFDTLYSFVDYTTFLVIFYAGILLVILVIVDIIYVSYSFQQKKFKYVWPLKVLRSVCSLLVTVLFLNFLELFCNFLKCLPGDDGELYMSLYEDVKCWSGLFILHASFAVAVSFVFVIICLIAAVALYESKETQNDISAKVTSRADFGVLIVKIVILYQYSFFYQQENHWFVISTTFIMSVIIYQGFRNNWPYYSDYMNKLMSLVTGIFVWGNIVLIIVKLLESTEFDGGLQIYFLGLPLVSLMIVYSKDERVKLLNSNINNFQRGEDIALQIRYFLNLVQTRETDRKNAIILRGYIYHHEDQCSSQDCCLRQYKNIMKYTISRKNFLAQSGNRAAAAGAASQNTVKSMKSEMNKLLLQHAKNMYRAAMRKFPTSTPLRIQYAFFLLQHMKRKQEAIAELTFANQFNPAFEEQFIIFRYLKMSEDFDDMGEGGNGGEEMDVVAKFAYDSSLRQFKESIHSSAQYHHDFWTQLKSDRPDMAMLNESGQMINKSVVEVEKFWESLQKLNPNQPQVMKIYSRYLSQVLNDKARGQELMARAKEATSGKQNFGEAETGLESAEVQRNGQPCFVVSGSNDDLGNVKMCNRAASRVFGYNQEEMVNHPVEKLMPSYIAKHHQNILRKALNSPPDHSAKDKNVYALHKSGYIFPIILQIKFMQTRLQQEDEDEQSGQFVGIIKLDKKLMSSNIAFILIDKEKRMINISSSCISMLGLDIQRLKRYRENGMTLDNFIKDFQIKNYFNQRGHVKWNTDVEMERQESKNSRTRSLPSSENFSKLKTIPTNQHLHHHDSKHHHHHHHHQHHRPHEQRVVSLECKIDMINMNDNDPSYRLPKAKQMIPLPEGMSNKSAYQLQQQNVVQNDVQHDIGHFVMRLDVFGAMEMNENFNKTSKGKEPKKKEAPIPDFFFKFDKFQGKFIRELAKAGFNNADDVSKDKGFINMMQMRLFSGTITGVLPDDFNSSIARREETYMLEESKGEESTASVNVDMIKIDIPVGGSRRGASPSVDLQSNGDQQSLELSHRTPLMSAQSPRVVAEKIHNLDITEILKRKKGWAKNVQVYRLVNGVFKYRESNEDIKRLSEMEEERKRIEEENEVDFDVLAFDNVSGNLNSKKTLQNALKDKRPIASISRLKFVMNISLICLVAMAATDYSVISKSFTDINENFNLIQKSYGRLAEFQRVAFAIRSLIMMNEGMMDPVQANYIPSGQDFQQFLKDDIRDALAQLYEYQSTMSLSPLEVSSGQHALFYEKEVSLFFRDTGSSAKILNFTINEAVLQTLSAVFTAKHLNFTDFKETNDDLHFININVYNDLFEALRMTSEYYVEDLVGRAEGEFKHIITLFLISATLLILMLFVLFPVVRSVNSARLKILSLFVDIPYSIAITLAAKCQKFIQSHQAQSDDINDKTEANSADDEGFQANNDDEDELADQQALNKKKNRARTPIFDNAMKDNTFFMQFGFGLGILLAYFVGMLVLSLNFTNKIQIITDEMNLVSQAESYYAFAQNVQREMIYDQTKEVLGAESFDVARDSLEILFGYNEMLLRIHYDNRKDLNVDYEKIFDDYFKLNACKNNLTVKFTLLPFNCDDYIYAQFGMQTVMTRYFELLKESMKQYITLKDANPTDNVYIAQQMVNSPVMRELYVLQFRFISDSLRFLVNKLTQVTNEDFQSTIDLKTIAFVVFVICISIAYLVFWLPFVIKLTKDMWRSKSMLSIIPIEVIVKMPRIHQFLLKQSFSDIKVNTNQVGAQGQPGSGEQAKAKAEKDMD